MISTEFQYFAPTTVDEALGLLKEHSDDAKLIAGGHSLLPAMKLRLAQPGVLIDISKVQELKGIHVNGAVSVGAAATYHEVLSSEAVQKACPVLVECCAQIGDIQVRNCGTLGGSLAHADPAADLPALVLALDATVKAKGPNGEREIKAGEMFVEMLTSALEPDEVLTQIVFPALGAGEGAAYEKMRHPASRYAIVGAAAYVKVDGGSVSEARVAITGAGPKAVRLPEVEAALKGSAGDEAAVQQACANAGETMEYMGDIQASEEYRKAMVKVYARRALMKALERAHG